MCLNRFFNRNNTLWIKRGPVRKLYLNTSVESWYSMLLAYWWLSFRFVGLACVIQLISKWNWLRSHNIEIRRGELCVGFYLWLIYLAFAEWVPRCWWVFQFGLKSVVHAFGFTTCEHLCRFLLISCRGNSDTKTTSKTETWTVTNHPYQAIFLQGNH